MTGTALRLAVTLSAIAGSVLTLGAGAQASDPAATVLVTRLDGDVNPVTRDHLVDTMRRATREGAAALVIELDTPGGLASSMRSIVKEMLATPIPVIVHVAPAGSSADSAGAVIGQAADIFAMAPQTNTGSATPVAADGKDIEGDLRQKAVNDAVAYIRALAREHGRNVGAAEAMVRTAANYPAREAVELHVADLVAATLPELLSAIDGTVVRPKGVVLATAGARIERVEMSGWKRALDLLIDPNVIAVMLSIGLVGLLVELWNPGLVFPGAVGAISLLVGLYALQVLPISVAGALFVALAAVFWVAEGLVVSHGALALAGAVTFVIGALMLFDPAGPAYQVSLWTAVAIAGAMTLLVGVAIGRVRRARRNPVAVGIGRLVGTTATVRETGWVTVAGERWQARDAGGQPPLPGATVRVTAIADGLALVVEPASEEDPR